MCHRYSIMLVYFSLKTVQNPFSIYDDLEIMTNSLLRPTRKPGESIEYILVMH